MRVLLLGTDRGVLDGVQRALDEKGVQVENGAHPRRVLRQALLGRHDVLVLERDRSDRDPCPYVLELRRLGAQVPILVLLHKEWAPESVRILDLGADDVLVEPFPSDELVARVRALARRRGCSFYRVLEMGDLRVNLASRRVWRGTRCIPLTKQEFALLEYLLRNRETVLTRTRIAEHVWGHRTGTSNVIDVYVRYLRRKLDSRGDSSLIHTVRGVGYMLSQSSR